VAAAVHHHGHKQAEQVEPVVAEEVDHESLQAVPVEQVV
jgi:hypothetical protein